MKNFDIREYLLESLYKIAETVEGLEYALFILGNICACLEFYNLKRPSRKKYQKYKEFKKTLCDAQGNGDGKEAFKIILTLTKGSRVSLIGGMKKGKPILSSDLYIFVFIIREWSSYIGGVFALILEAEYKDELPNLIDQASAKAFSLKILLDMVEQNLLDSLLSHIRKDILESVFTDVYCSLHILNFNLIEYNTDDSFQVLEMQAIRILLALDIEVPDID